ncbi:MAG: nucleotidyltransferase domain-containing protein [Prolixibacteraceae bacterium]|nr:nucleotidyltransferase domain-containing protein [Prolixibacteraceae bacterium]
MELNNTYIVQLKERFKKLNPHLVVLFGSYAYGNPGSESDFDIMVVTNDNFIPKSFKEKTDLYITVSKYIIDVSREIPIDLIIYTKPMFMEFIEQGSSFSKDILNKGVVLYEGKHQTMA